MKITKNNVSYFEAGFKAAMVIFGNMTEAEVKRKFYSTTLYPNVVRECLRDYDSMEDDGAGTDAMLRNI